MKRLLVVVDMQNDFIDGALGTKEALAIVPEVVKKIKEYKLSKDQVIFTQDTHNDHYLDTLEGKNLPVVHCVRNTEGWELHPDIAPYASLCFEKNGFGSLECARYVGEQGCDLIELVGLCTDIFVITNAILIKAQLPETPVKVDSSCCAGVTPESHENALKAMRMCQIEVV